MSDLELTNRRLERERAARKAAEELLEQKSRELFVANQQYRDLAEQTHSIIETAAEGIVSYDASGVIQGFNQSARQIFEVEDALGTKVFDLFEASQDIEATLLTPTNEADAEQLELNAVRQGEAFVAEVAVSSTQVSGALIFTALVRDLSKRKVLEARLSQAQKMESVGQLAAGVAHEINTPIQFIGDNIQFLQGAFEDLGELFDMFDRLLGTLKEKKTTDEVVEEIEKQSELVDLPFLREEFPGAIEQSLEGIDTVASIVRALKDFSSNSSSTKSALDINRSIESALAVTANLFREIGEVTVSLSPDLEHVFGFGAQLNQVLLNLLTNSAEAIKSHRDAGEGLVHIQTRAVDDGIELRVRDNGPGIPQSIMDRIYDPFFTTKEVGAGTGQGLAFVYDTIVNKHAGTIIAKSLEDGAGAEFVVFLPTMKTNMSRQRDHENSVC